MQEFTITHDTLRDGDFPIERLNKLSTIQVTKLPNDDMFKEDYKIEFTPDEGEDPLTAAYTIGMLVQQTLILRRI